MASLLGSDKATSSTRSKVASPGSHDKARSFSSARASLFELRSALGQLTSSPKQAIDVDGSAQQRQLTASSPGEIKWDGTQFVMTADLKVNGTITADTCACGAR